MRITRQVTAALSLAVLVAVCSLVGVTSSSARPLADGLVRIRVLLDESGRGVFMVEGAISDSGHATARSSHARGRVRLTETLEGSAGTIVVRVVQTCRQKRSTWRVASASGDYAGLTGAGAGTGGLRCAKPRASLRALYQGKIRTATPGPALAQPGSYGGWSSQDEHLTFDVLPDGRHLANVRLERLTAACSSSPALLLQPAFLATYPIAEDGSFSIAFGGSAVSGRLSGSQAQGTISYESTDGGCSSGPVTWTASSPPPALPSAQPGRYCGSTAQGVGVCANVTTDGRVSGLRLEVVLDCVQPEAAQFTTVISFGGAVPLRSNLSLEVDGSLEDAAAGMYSLLGTFGDTGRASGNVLLRHVTYDLDGTIFTCKDAAVQWSAKRLGP